MEEKQAVTDKIKSTEHNKTTKLPMLILLCISCIIYPGLLSSEKTVNYVEKAALMLEEDEASQDACPGEKDGPLPWGDFYRKMYEQMHQQALETQAEINRKVYLHDIRGNVYAVPYVRYLTDYAHANKYYRGSEGDSVKNRDERYTAYLDELYERRGMPVSEIYDAKPAYTYLSIQHYASWRSIFTDHFAIYFPNDVSYGSSDECADMLYTRTEEELAAEGFERLTIQWERDMRLEENRLADRGRLYLLAVSGENYAEEGLSAHDIDLPGIEELLARENIASRIRSVLPEEVAWTDCRFVSTPYHEYAHARGETTLRNIAVYLPQMREHESFQWILLIEEFKDGAEDKTGIFECRQDIIDRFIIFPYWYEIEEGDTLWNLAGRFFDRTHPLAVERTIETICSDPLNRIENPDVISPGQRLFLAPHVFVN